MSEDRAGECRPRHTEDTIMASFKGCGAYRRFVEEVFPVVPVTPTGRDSY